METYKLSFTTRGNNAADALFEASSDRVAIEHAERLRAGHAAELWNRARIVRTFADKPARL